MDFTWKTGCMVFGGLIFGFFWIVTAAIATPSGALVNGVLSALLCVWILWFHRRRNRKLSDSFEDYADDYNVLTPKQLTMILLNGELQKLEISRPVARKTLIGRSVLALVGIVVNFLLINANYYNVECAVQCGLLAIGFTLLWNGFSTQSVLFRCARKNPKKVFSQIVQEEICDQNTMRYGRGAAWGLSALMVVLLVVFACLHMEPVWKFAENNSGYTLVSYRPAMLGGGDVEIPAQYQGQKVISIGKRAFADATGVKSVTIPDSVRVIDKQAFCGCSHLETVNLSKNVVSIGSGAFKNCKKLRKITLPETLVELLGEAFMGCSELESITIPQKVTEIRGNTFDGCSALKDVQLHDGIADIHAYAFQDCSSLEAIDLPEKITEIHTYTFAGCKSLREITIPSGVTRIAARAFYDCDDLTEVFIPDTVLEIRSSAFRSCENLRNVEIPERTEVAESAFKDSPTKQVKKIFSDAVRQSILLEIQEKEVDVYYYVYKTESPDTVRDWGDGVSVFIADDEVIGKTLSQGEALGKLENNTALLEYLQKAKEAGFTTVQYAMYSATASRIVSEPFFVGAQWEINEMIEKCRELIAEEVDG